VRPYRQRLLGRSGLVALGCAAVVILPHAVWLSSHVGLVKESLTAKAGLSGGTTAAGALRALRDIAVNTALSLAPVGVVGLLVFASTLRRAAGGGDGDDGRLLAGYSAAVLAVLLGLVAVGTNRFHERWLQPFLILAPLLLFVRVGAASRTRSRAFAAAVALVAV